jgi:DNA-binding FadR family transcriptional regulator
MATGSCPDDPLVRAALGRNLTFGLQDALGRAIVAGEYDDKPFPNEGEIVKAYGVSRSVTREAVKMLATKGLLSGRPRQGTFVRPENDWNLFDTDVLRWLLDRRSSILLLRRFTELRIGVEPQAAALAAFRATDDQRKAIEVGLQRMRDADGRCDEPLDADIAFHVAVLRASNNPFLMQFRDLVSTALRTSIRFSNQIAGRTACLADHAAVCNAIIVGDADAASRSMHTLISDVLTLIEDAV